MRTWSHRTGPHRSHHVGTNGALRDLRSGCNTSAMRSALAGLVGLLIPGAGHALLGRRRAAAVFVAPIVLILAIAAVLYLQGGLIGIGAFIVTPGVLPALAVLNVAVLGWRIIAGVDAARWTDRPWPTA